MGKSILTKSDKFSSEYCISIVKVGEIKPIKGKDKIGYTLVNGETIVVRKDQVKEGDILFYASNECQLNKDFLGVNNLFESASYELNRNSSEVESFVLKNKELKAAIDKNEKNIDEVSKALRFLNNFRYELDSADSDDEKNIVLKRYDKFAYKLQQMVGGEDNEHVDKYIKDKTHENEEYNKRIEKNAEFIRQHVGFFNKTGRVRAIKLGGIRSMGFLFSINELSAYNADVHDINLEEFVGEDFDTVNGELFVKAYVPFVPEKAVRNRTKKRQKKVEKFDRIIQGEFFFHYDTEPFPKCIEQFHPEDKVVISSKLHGTSSIFAKVHVKKPIKLPLYKWIWNKFIDITHLFKSHRITDYIIEYGNVTSSRTVIKNQYINKNVKEGYYDSDIWSEYGELIYPYLDEGMTLYGEICGYLTGSEKMIQKGYDYGCEKGENFLMPYRITTTNADGTKKEWDVIGVHDWTVNLIKEHSDIADRLRPITILYHGTLGELYKDIKAEKHWRENFLEAIRKDKKRFYMEKNDPICIHQVPFEGICIRKDNDDIAECYKLKTTAFLKKEAELMDDIATGKEEISEEMLEAYS